MDAVIASLAEAFFPAQKQSFPAQQSSSGTDDDLRNYSQTSGAECPQVVVQVGDSLLRMSDKQRGQQARHAMPICWR